MKKPPDYPPIIFLNQWAGPLFRELAEDISKRWSPSLLITGHPHTLQASQTASLCIISGPTYRRESHISRILSWFKYLVYVFFRCWRLWSVAILFLVSNPPFLGLVGYLFKRLRGQYYIVLVYDIHPDILVQFGTLKESGLVARLWRRMNRLVWENAEIVFTIGERMAANLEQHFDASKTRPGRVIVIPNWANTGRIRPTAKDKNEFAKQHGQVGKLTVMYSGNLGQTHDIESILAAATELKEYNSIHFMIIGDGAKRNLVEEVKGKEGLDNLTILPFQPEDVLPTSLPTADIAVVTLDRGSECLMVPSKTYYHMAAGSALLGICDQNSEVAQIINRHHCGLVVSPGDKDSMVKNILNLLNDKVKLENYKSDSRKAAEKYYSRENTHCYIDALSSAGLID